MNVEADGLSCQVDAVTEGSPDIWNFLFILNHPPHTQFHGRAVSRTIANTMKKRKFPALRQRKPVRNVTESWSIIKETCRHGLFLQIHWNSHWKHAMSIAFFES